MADFESGLHIAERLAALGKHSVTPEQDSKSRSNVIATSSTFATTAWQCASTVATALTSIGVRALIAAALDKPTTVAAVTRTQPRTLTDLPQCSGLDQSVMLATAPPKSMPLIPELTSEHADEMSLASLSMTPSLLLNFAMSPSAITGATLVSIPVNPKWLPYDMDGVSYNSPFPGTLYPTVLSKAAVPFSYWRGTMRYKLYFFCTSFHTARISVTFVPLTGISGVPSPVPVTDTMTRFVDIAGDTEADFDIPFSFPNLYARHAIGTLVISVATPISELSTTAPAPIYASVYVSSGSDIVYKQLSNQLLIPRSAFGFVESPIPPVVPHSNPRADFATAFDPIYSRALSNTVTDPSFHDSFGSVADVVHQPVLFGSSIQPPSGTTVYYTGTPTTAQQYSFSTLGPTVLYANASTSNAAVATTTTVWGFSITLSGAPGNPLNDNATPTGTYYIPPSIHFADSYKFQRGGFRVKMLSYNKLDTSVLRTVQDVLWPQSEVNASPAIDYPLPPPYYGPISTPYLTSGALQGRPDQHCGPPTTLITLDYTSEIEVPMSTHALFRTTGTPTRIVQSPPGIPPSGLSTFPVDSSAEWITIKGVLSPTGMLVDRLYSSLADGFRFHYIKGPRSSFLVRGSLIIGPTINPAGAPSVDVESTVSYY